MHTPEYKTANIAIAATPTDSTEQLPAAPPSALATQTQSAEETCLTMFIALVSQ